MAAAACSQIYYMLWLLLKNVPGDSIGSINFANTGINNFNVIFLEDPSKLIRQGGDYTNTG